MTFREHAHFFDMRTSYCTQCGIGVDKAIENRVLYCEATENVVAISHRVRGQVLQKLEKDIGP